MIEHYSLKVSWCLGGNCSVFFLAHGRIFKYKTEHVLKLKVQGTDLWPTMQHTLKPFTKATGRFGLEKEEKKTRIALSAPYG